MEDISNYQKLRADAQSFYNSIGKIYSPAFNQEIYFTSEGFNHEKTPLLAVSLWCLPSAYVLAE